ncbi:hypothetical protein L6452_42450 [Arctium lappa]|uniref:Uncharacterized protein n=1 Tax=Arctium lappa TaxID=4217 RepID=A0ACB8XHP1_ARCLA|nr:hypothetical protein L6452_42450 [Arctium lappa]
MCNNSYIQRGRERGREKKGDDFGERDEQGERWSKIWRFDSLLKNFNVVTKPPSLPASALTGIDLKAGRTLVEVPKFCNLVAFPSLLLHQETHI